MFSPDFLVCRRCAKSKPASDFSTKKYLVKSRIYRYPSKECHDCRIVLKRIEYKKYYKSKATKPSKIEGEKWESIDTNYYVSDLGRVRRNFKQILKPEITARGYQRVILSINGKPSKKSLHRLVAKAFIRNPENKPQVNHIDGNPLNNKASNLEWCTQSENQIHAFKTGLQKSKKHGNL